MCSILNELDFGTAPRSAKLGQKPRIQQCKTAVGPSQLHNEEHYSAVLPKFDFSDTDTQGFAGRSVEVACLGIANQVLQTSRHWTLSKFKFSHQKERLQSSDAGSLCFLIGSELSFLIQEAGIANAPLLTARPNLNFYLQTIVSSPSSTSRDILRVELELVWFGIDATVGANEKHATEISALNNQRMGLRHTSFRNEPMSKALISQKLGVLLNDQPFGRSEGRHHYSLRSQKDTMAHIHQFFLAPIAKSPGVEGKDVSMGKRGLKRHSVASLTWNLKPTKWTAGVYLRRRERCVRLKGHISIGGSGECTRASASGRPKEVAERRCQRYLSRPTGYLDCGLHFCLDCKVSRVALGSPSIGTVTWDWRSSARIDRNTAFVNQVGQKAIEWAQLDVGASQSDVHLRSREERRGKNEAVDERAEERRFVEHGEEEGAGAQRVDVVRVGGKACGSRVGRWIGPGRGRDGGRKRQRGWEGTPMSLMRFWVSQFEAELEFRVTNGLTRAGSSFQLATIKFRSVLPDIVYRVVAKECSQGVLSRICGVFFSHRRWHRVKIGAKGICKLRRGSFLPNSCSFMNQTVTLGTRKQKAFQYKRPDVAATEEKRPRDDEDKSKRVTLGHTLRNLGCRAGLRVQPGFDFQSNYSSTTKNPWTGSRP
ncbi:hypothetical protein C8R46DRAFT_1294296 [Mycena filopes]|nr:hypothetical protein C8R46DRAFT_1294296 [Mycena filopes]